MTPKKQPNTNKVLVSVRMDQAVLAAAKSAAYWTPGETLGGLVEEALRREVQRLERLRGKPFPPAGKLRSGRPLKT